MTQIPAPVGPVRFDPLSHGVALGRDRVEEILAPLDTWWARIDTLHFDRYRQDVLEGRIHSVFGVQIEGELPASQPMVAVSGSPLPGHGGAAPASSVPRPTTMLRRYELPRLVPVKVVRSTGELDPDWILLGPSSQGMAHVFRLTPAGPVHKRITVEELLTWNASLLVPGTIVRVPRSSGEAEDGWVVLASQDDRLLVEKGGVGRKQIMAAQLAPLVAPLWGHLPLQAPEPPRPQPLSVAVGTDLRIYRSEGNLEPGWTVGRQEGNQLHLQREGAHGMLQKRLRLEMALIWNPDLLPTGTTLRLEIDGTVVDGWLLVAASWDGLEVVHVLHGTRIEPLEVAIRMNRDRLLGEGEPPFRFPSPEARAQRLAYARDHLLEGYVWDGFVDGGRHAALDTDYWPVATQREVLVVDRACDLSLRAHIHRVQTTLEDLEPVSRLQELAKYVHEQMGGPISRVEERVALAAARMRQQPLLIGDVPRVLGGGIVRHRTLLFQVLAEELGLSSAMVRGDAGTFCPSPHAWNLVELPDMRVAVDLSRPAAQAFAALQHPWTQRYYHPHPPRGDLA